MNVNWARFVVWAMYLFFENQYFGWNWTAHSDAEMIADGIGVILIALSIEPKEKYEGDSHHG